MHYLLFVHNGIVSQYQKNYLDRCNFLHIQIIFHTIKAEQMTRWLSPIKEKRHNHCVLSVVFLMCSLNHMFVIICGNLVCTWHMAWLLDTREREREQEQDVWIWTKTETTDPLRIKTLFRQEGLVFERSCTASYWCYWIVNCSFDKIENSWYWIKQFSEYLNGCLCSKISKWFLVKSSTRNNSGFYLLSHLFMSTKLNGISPTTRGQFLLNF